MAEVQPAAEAAVAVNRRERSELAVESAAVEEPHHLESVVEHAAELAVVGALHLVVAGELAVVEGVVSQRRSTLPVADERSRAPKGRPIRILIGFLFFFVLADSEPQ